MKCKKNVQQKKIDGNDEDSENGKPNKNTNNMKDSLTHTYTHEDKGNQQTNQ